MSEVIMPTLKSKIYQAINHMIPNFTKQTESGEGKEAVVEKVGL
jgi:preprotein translocase subunit SecA